MNTWKLNTTKTSRLKNTSPTVTTEYFRGRGGHSKNDRKEAGAELGQAQVKLDDIVVIVVEVVVKSMVKVEVQLLLRVGGWSDKTK